MLKLKHFQRFTTIPLSAESDDTDVCNVAIIINLYTVLAKIIRHDEISQLYKFFFYFLFHVFEQFAREVLSVD